MNTDVLHAILESEKLCELCTQDLDPDRMNGLEIRGREELLISGLAKAWAPSRDGLWLTPEGTLAAALARDVSGNVRAYLETFLRCHKAMGYLEGCMNTYHRDMHGNKPDAVNVGDLERVHGMLNDVCGKFDDMYVGRCDSAGAHD